MKETKDDMNRWKVILYLQIERNNVVKMTILPEAMNRFKAIPIKIPMAFFTEVEQIILKLCMETQKTLNNQDNLEKGEQSWRYHAR